MLCVVCWCYWLVVVVVGYCLLFVGRCLLVVVGAGSLLWLLVVSCLLSLAFVVCYCCCVLWIVGLFVVVIRYCCSLIVVVSV